MSVCPCGLIKNWALHAVSMKTDMEINFGLRLFAFIFVLKSLKSHLSPLFPLKPFNLELLIY